MPMLAVREATSASGLGQTMRSGGNGNGLLNVPADKLPPGPFDAKTLSKDTTSAKTTHDPVTTADTTIKSDPTASKKLAVKKKPIAESNPNHDDRGRFSSGSGAAYSLKDDNTVQDDKGRRIGHLSAQLKGTKDGTIVSHAGHVMSRSGPSIPVRGPKTASDDDSMRDGRMATARKMADTWEKTAKFGESDRLPIKESGLRDDTGRYDSALTSMADATKSVGTFVDGKGNRKFALYELKGGKRVRVGTAGDDAALRAHLGLKESDRIALKEHLSFHPQFIEGTYNPDKRTAEVIILTEGTGNSRDKHYYGADTIADAVASKVFEGAQCYADHPGQDEETNRPERSIRDLIGYFFNCRVVTTNGKTSLAATFKIQEGADWVIGLIKSAIEYAKKFPNKVYAGISINADGDVEPRSMAGQDVNYVHKITGAFSADIVTKPARGGKFLSLVESASGARTQKEAHMANKLAESAARIQAQIAEGSIDQDDLKAFLQESAAMEAAVKEGKSFCDKHDMMDECGMQEAKTKEAFPPGAKAPPFKSSDGGDQSDDSDDDDDDSKGGKKTITIQEGGKAKESVKESEQFKHVYNMALAEAQRAVSSDVKELQHRLAEAQAREHLRESIDIVKTKLKESSLPAAAAAKLMPSLVGQSVEVMDSLIEAEANYLAAIGVSKTATAGNPGRVNVRESDTSNTSAIFAGMGV